MNIEFKRLTEVEKSEIIELMNHPLVRRQMPLTSDNFSESDFDNFIAAGELEIGENVSFGTDWRKRQSYLLKHRTTKRPSSCCHFHQLALSFVRRLHTIPIWRKSGKNGCSG